MDPAVGWAATRGLQIFSSSQLLKQEIMSSSDLEHPTRTSNSSTLRHAIWRGISIIAPPLVTLLLLIWFLNTMESYVLRPLETAIRQGLVTVIADTREEAPPGSKPLDPQNPDKGFTYQGFTYVLPPLGRYYVPDYIISYVNANLDRLPKDMQRPLSANDYRSAYVKLRYMPRSFIIPLLLLIVLSSLFFIGRFFAAGLGRFVFNVFENVIQQIPLVSNVYSSVKQVTDFVFSEREIQFTRVVGIEYPRAGLWSLAFVTGEGLSQLKNSIGKDMVSVFVPTSPMPMTGFTVSVPKSDVVDIDITIDQAIQFIVSCGVVCPAPDIKALPGGSLKLPDKAGKPRSP
jgi:uncharacterized membrane protein